MNAQLLTQVISGPRFHWRGEKDLQDGIEFVLRGESIGYEREHKLGSLGVIDFLVGRVGVEVKIKGQASSVIAQLKRYASHPEVDELLLVTGRMQLTRMPDHIDGVPLHVVALTGSLF